MQLLVLKALSCSLFVFPSWAWNSASFTVARPRRLTRQVGLSLSPNEENVNLEDLKLQLLEYLEKRKEVGADDLAKAEIGKVVGGTKGNAILEYVSGAPNKAFRIENPANIFDYDELTKYGYGTLVTPIMKAGGRFAMYELLGMDTPPVTSKPKQVSAPELVIDRTGELDPGRYSGLKLGQALDDTAQSAALEAARQKAKQGKRLRPKLAEEEYERPFADVQNAWKTTPDWTPERIDEWAAQQKRASTWVRQAQEGKFIPDPFENLDLGLEQRAFSVLSAALLAISFGKATPAFLDMIGATSGEGPGTLFTVLQVPAATLGLVALASSALCAIQAPEKNRGQFLWFVKGLLGGPFAVNQLRGLPDLLTRGEQDALDNIRKSGSTTLP